MSLFPNQAPVQKNSAPETRLFELDLSQNEENIDLSEVELRELYDIEEMNRFLGLFSALVTEVQEQINPKDEGVGSEEMHVAKQSLSTPSSGHLDSDEPGASIQTSVDQSSPTFAAATSVQNTNLAAVIAYRYLMPILPPARPEAPSFTVGRLRLTLQRLYLATVPPYTSFFSNLLALATWENPKTSLLYCTLYWILWWQNFLVPGFVLGILYSLLKRRIFRYPTLDELRRHREELLRADEFGQKISERLSASSSSVVAEAWRLFKLYDHTKNKYKGTARGKAKSNQGEEESSVPDSVEDSEVTKDMKRVGLQILENIAEFHERVANIFHWRRPTSSRKYATLLFLLFLITLLPTRYISKLGFLVLGVVFWHVIPVIASLPPSERDRISLILFNDVPTDGEYAMELISQRVAAGLPIKQTRVRPSVGPTKSHDVGSSNVKDMDTRGNSIVWKRLGDVVAIGKSAIIEGKQLSERRWPLHENWPLQDAFAPGLAQARSYPDAQTYLCRHTSGPGMIILTESNLLFTSLMSQTPKIVIRLAAVKGIKKAGLLKGLHIRWHDTLAGPDGPRELKEEKFAWIGGRDELFARLVSSQGKSWVTI